MISITLVNDSLICFVPRNESKKDLTSFNVCAVHCAVHLRSIRLNSYQVYTHTHT